MSPEPPSSPRDGVEAPQAASRSLLLLLAAAAGLGAANLYYGQPLAAAIGESLRAPPAAIGTALTATQIGYALGMILLVPLGDAAERRSLIVTTVSFAVPALLLVAISRSVPALVAGSLLVGAASSVAQMIVPYSVDLAPARDRGRVVGTVMAGLLAGILLSRTASGAIGAAFGWRAVYVIAAGAMAAWSRGGWPAVCATGGVFALLGLLPLAAERRRGPLT
jgi:predicted MFS family arabinose efflux permease